MQERTLKDYRKLIDLLKQSFIGQLVLRSYQEGDAHDEAPSVQLQRIFSENPRLIVIFNHATPLSWLPMVGGVGHLFLENGADNRIPVGIIDRFFYSNPILQKVAEYLTQSKTPLTKDHILAQLTDPQVARDLILMPEGANAFFGDASQVQEFRSNRFIEMAILSEVPILVITHKGSEDWSSPVQIPKEVGQLLNPFSRFFASEILSGKAFNLPTNLRKLKTFEVTFSLVKMPISRTELPLDRFSRDQIIQAEALRIRELMNKMLSAN